MAEADGKPIGELTLRTLAMPADANAAGDIFGGWVMAQMDLACGIRAAERAKGRVVTAAVKEMSFAKPMKIGDTLCVYTHVKRVGRTSMTLKVEAWAQRYLSDLMEKVTDADFVMVALDKSGKPKPVPQESSTPIAHHPGASWRLHRSRSHAAALIALDVAARPFAERIDRHQQLAAEVGQLVVDARRDRRKDGARDEAVALQVAQRRRQHLLRDAADHACAAR